MKQSRKSRKVVNMWIKITFIALLVTLTAMMVAAIIGSILWTKEESEEEE